MVHHGAKDIKRVVPDLSEPKSPAPTSANTPPRSISTISAASRSTRSIPISPRHWCSSSTDTVHWLHELGACDSCRTTAGRPTSTRADSSSSAASVIYANGGGAGWSRREYKAAEKHGVEIRYGARATALLRGRRRHRGRARRRRAACEEEHPRASAVVLACGGFEANREWRTRYLGPGWDMAKVRGTRYNTGDGIRMALDVGAQPYGQWSGCHAVSPGSATPAITATSTIAPRRLAPQLSVRHHGQRGRQALSSTKAPTSATTPMPNTAASCWQQPGSYAWQMFDCAGRCTLLRDEYKMRGATKVVADTLEELVDADAGRQRQRSSSRRSASTTPRSKRDVPFDPEYQGRQAAPSGSRSTRSNWANTIEKPPFEAYSVGCGITFTFGGLKIDTAAPRARHRGRAASRVFMPRANWSAGFSISTIPVRRD